MRFPVLLALSLVVGSLATWSASVAAEPGFAVIVNERNPVRALDKKTLADMFLKKRAQWGNETVILPVDLKRASPVRKQFSEQVLGRSVEAVRTYWNRLVFSGRAVPPPELASDDDVMAYVARHPGAIGYVSRAAELRDVKRVEVR